MACKALRCQQREHHDFIHVTANPLCMNAQMIFSLWAGRECSVKYDGVLMSLRQNNKIANGSHT